MYAKEEVSREILNIFKWKGKYNVSKCVDVAKTVLGEVSTIKSLLRKKARPY
jgi:hypothetical protein